VTPLSAPFSALTGVPLLRSQRSPVVRVYLAPPHPLGHSRTGLEVAARLIGEQGYEPVTMTAVAENSHASVRTLYDYFPDKQTLARALAAQYAEEADEHWKQLLESSSILDRAALAESLPKELSRLRGNGLPTSLFSARRSPLRVPRQLGCLCGEPSPTRSED